MRTVKILVVDDIADIRDLIIDQLSEIDSLEFHEAANGLEAIEVASECHPDIILMDANMPVMDGWSATMKIKENPELAKAIIISVTAYPEKDTAINCGSDDYLKKPFEKRQLIEKIEHHLKKFK
jgi:CheY-like chemotaxis protein